MRFLEIAKRNLKELYREPVAFGFLLVMPLAFILIFSFAFGMETMPPTSIGVVQEDQSYEASAFVEVLKQVESNPPEEISAFHLTTYPSKEAAMKEMKVGKLTGLLIIPEGFGKTIETETPVPLKVLYDQKDPMAAPRVIPIIEKVALSFLGIQIPLALEVRGTMTEVKNEFINFFIPGMIVFSLMILIPGLAGTIARDKEKGFLSRLLTLPFTPSDFIFGYSLPNLLVIAIQILTFIGVGKLLKLTIIGNFGLAFLIFFLLGLNCLAMGMILGSLVKNEEQAEAVPWIFLVPLAMLSGTFFSIDMMPDILIDIMKVLPFIHAVDASRSVITYGATLADILTDLYWLIGWAVVLFAAGIILFRRRMISR